MKWYTRLSLKTKFLIVASFVVLIICASLYFFIDRVFRSYLQSEMQKQAAEIADSLQDRLANFIDPEQVQISAERMLTESRDISRIAIYRRIGDFWQPFIKAEAIELPASNELYRTALTRRAPFRSEFHYKQKEYWEFAYPIMNGTHIIGLTSITLNFSQYKVFMDAVRAGTLAILVVGLILLLIIMNVYIEVTVGRPLSEIVDAMSEVKQSRFDVRLKPHVQDEIGLLAGDFNTMTEALGEAQEEIMRQNRMLEQRVREATSELRSRNLELFEAQDELRRANRLATAGQVAAMLAHDLGSPLSSISGHLQLMLEDPTRSSMELQRLRLLLTQVERLSDTIRNFLKNVTGLEAHFQECDLNALVEHLIELTWPVLTERRINPQLEMDPRLPRMQADPNQLQQLFLNLFTNSIDAMKEGGTLRICTKYREQGDQKWTEIVVEDTGTGMTPDHLKNLFRPFFSTKEFGKGSGLGLAICREIVKAHSGEIRVESIEGKGTKFTIELPVVTATMIEHEENEPARSR